MKLIKSVRVDGCRCTGHKLCLSEAPGVFSFDAAKDIAFVIPGASSNFTVDAKDVYAAAAVCPMDAILINGQMPERAR